MEGKFYLTAQKVLISVEGTVGLEKSPLCNHHKDNDFSMKYQQRQTFDEELDI